MPSDPGAYPARAGMVTERRRLLASALGKFVDALRLPKGVRDLCLIAFLAEVACGVVQPTFSLYLQGLGASLGLIGLIGAAAGAARLLTSLPVGTISDWIGRRSMVLACLAMFSLACLLFTLVSSAWFQMLPYALLGVSGSLFPLEAAYIADVVEPGERARGTAFLMAAVGAGYALGAALGGWATAGFGYEWTYRSTGAALAVILGFAWLRLSPTPEVTKTDTAYRKLGRMSVDLVLTLVHHRQVMVATVGNLVFSLTFGAAILTFLPVHVRGLGGDPVFIGTIFMLRGVVSTGVRIPVGYLVERVSTRHVMVAAVLTEMAVCILIGTTHDLTALDGLLAVEGIASGAFWTAGQIHVLHSSPPAQRGAVMTFYSLASPLGTTLGGMATGIVAQTLGTAALFICTGGVVAALLGVMVALGVLRESKTGTVVG